MYVAGSSNQTPAVKSRVDVQAMNYMFAHITCRVPAACGQGKLSTASLLLNSPSLPEVRYRKKLSEVSFYPWGNVGFANYRYLYTLLKLLPVLCCRQPSSQAMHAHLIGVQHPKRAIGLTLQNPARGGSGSWNSASTYLRHDDHCDRYLFAAVGAIA